MIVIASKTELRLMKDLHRCVKETPNQKCFYMQFSKSDVPKKELFKTFLKLLEELPSSYTAQVYLCKDKDIFIMMKGFMQRHFLEFIQKLSATLKAKELVGLIDVFEVGVHWKKLEALCKQKTEAVDTEKERTEEEKRKAKAEKATLKVLETLDASLVKDLGARREKRKDSVILVVDDDQLSRTLVGNVLAKDFKTNFAKTGAEALSKYLVSAPDVLFLDIGLPDISGHEVLECIFQMDPDGYVIMFSGRKDKENIVRALEIGAQGFVGKPFSRDNLFEHIMKSPFIRRKKEAVGQPKQAAM